MSAVFVCCHGYRTCFRSLWYFVMGQTFTFAMTVAVSGWLCLSMCFWVLRHRQLSWFVLSLGAEHGTLQDVGMCLKLAHKADVLVLTRQELLLRVNLSWFLAIPMAIVSNLTAFGILGS